MRNQAYVTLQTQRLTRVVGGHLSRRQANTAKFWDFRQGESPGIPRQAEVLAVGSGQARPKASLSLAGRGGAVRTRNGLQGVSSHGSCTLSVARRYLRDVALADINRSVLERLIEAKSREGVEPATVNRVLQLVRAVLRKAALEWEWLDRVPSFRFLKEPKRRVRFLTRAEAEQVIAALPSHLAAMARFSLETGLRQANVSGLQRSQLDLVRRCAWIHPDQAKAGRAIAVPLTTAAVAVVRKQMGKHETHVFTFRGKPVRQVNTKA
jgi:hypothetical protein